MTAWQITETPDTPEVHPTVVFADDALGALDAFAEAEGFVPYSELPDYARDWVGVDEHGRTWAIFTNTTIWAIPAKPHGDDTGRDVVPRQQQMGAVLSDL